MGKRVLLGVTGGISAYKSVDIVRGLFSLGHQVVVVMTSNATRFVQPRCFFGVPVHCDMWNDHTPLYNQDSLLSTDIVHVDLASWAEVFVVAPATANVIGKFAHGIADDLISTFHLALPECVTKIMYPAMNTRMFEHPAVQQNMKVLRFRGWDIQRPDTGQLACGATGVGKLPNPRKIVEYVGSVLGDKATVQIGNPLFRKPCRWENLADFIGLSIANILPFER